MHLSDNHRSGRLPKRFPVGTTYVVEGRGGEEGHPQVFSRYLVLPGGRRINLSRDFGGPASIRARAGGRLRNRAESQAGSGQKRRTPGRKKL
jgi:hypothetical protein